MEIRVKRLHTIILFAMLFIVVGWVTPAGYAMYAPQDHFIEQHSFNTNDAHVGQETHTACFDRTVGRDSTGAAFTELYLVSEDGRKTEVLSKNRKKLFQTGRATILIETEFPDDIATGTYYYERAYVMSLANGRVERTFIFKSDKFNITEDKPQGTDDATC